MKKSLFLILTVLSIFFITDTVNADSLINEAPNFSDRYYLNGTTLKGVYEQNISVTSINSFGWDIYPNVYNYFYYSGTGADIIQNMGIQWSSKDWCKQSEINFTGYLVPHSTMASTAFFYAVSDFNLYLETDTGSYLCSITREILDVSGGQVSSLKFSCNAPKSTSNTRNFKFLLNFNSYPSATGSYWGIQQSTFKYSCDIDTTDMINNQNQNTQNIINNQNQNSQNIINNQNQNSQNIINNQNQNSQNIINNQNQNQQQTNEKLDGINNSLNNPTVESGTGNSFFNDFSTTDNGGISSIITSPLVAINAMLDNTCTPMSVTYKGKEVSLPCGTEFWVKASTIRDYLNWFEGGILVYLIIRKLYKLIESMKNPDEDRVEVMDL